DNTRFSEDFSWLRYENGNTLDIKVSVLYDEWNTTQIAAVWTATMDIGQDRANVYGIYGYVKPATETHGAVFVSPMIPEIQRDSVLMLAFNAVDYLSSTGEQDANELRIRLTGGEFEDGATEKVIDLGFYDKSSPLIQTKMWENTQYNFLLHKPAQNPEASTIQVEFITGEELASPRNRLFIDNVRIYTVSQFEPEIKD